MIRPIRIGVNALLDLNAPIMVVVLSLKLLVVRSEEGKCRKNGRNGDGWKVFRCVCVCVRKSKRDEKTEEGEKF